MSMNDVRGGRNASNARATGQQRQNSSAAGAAAEASRKVPGKAAQPNNNHTPASTSTSTPLPTLSENEPIQTFNVEEVEKFLSRGISPQAQVYVVHQQSTSAKASPWGKKCAMANGRDFWLELRKQVTALRQSGGVSQGG